MDSSSSAGFHRKVLHGIALLMFAASSLLVVGPLALGPTTPLMDKFLGIDVPLQYQRAAVVIQGACGLVGAVLLITFHPASWWILMVTGVLGVVHGVTSVPAFLPTFVNIVFLLYLFSMKRLYVAATTPGPTASPAARSR